MTTLTSPELAALFAQLQKERAQLDLCAQAAIDAIVALRGQTMQVETLAKAIALMAEKNAEIAFSPGVRWGGALLPGSEIRRSEEHTSELRHRT